MANEVAAINGVELANIGAFNNVSPNNIAAINHVPFIITVPPPTFNSSIDVTYVKDGEIVLGDGVSGSLSIKDASNAVLFTLNASTNTQVAETFLFNDISVDYWIDISLLTAKEGGYSVATDRRWRSGFSGSYTEGGRIPASGLFSETTVIEVQIKNSANTWPAEESKIKNLENTWPPEN